MIFCARKCAISGLRTSISIEDDEGAPSTTPSCNCNFAGCVVVELPRSGGLRRTSRSACPTLNRNPGIGFRYNKNKCTCSTHRFPRNGQPTCLLTPMDRFWLHIICASLLLLVTAFALGTPGLKAPGSQSEAPPEKALLLRVAIR